MGGEIFSPAVRVPIHKSRIIRLPDSVQAKALAALGNMNFIPVSPELLKELFPGTRFDTARMLSEQATAADEYAKKREDEAADPFFAKSRIRMLEEATAHRELARYTRSIFPELFPYLVKAEVYFEGTGNFDVTLRGDELVVYHGSLGHSTPPKRRVVVLVFSERKVKTLKLGSGMAE
jgi:hypothetical protein